MFELVDDGPAKIWSLYLRKGWRHPGVFRLPFLAEQEKQTYSFREVKDTGVFFLHIPKCAGVSINHSLYGTLGAGHVTLDDALMKLGPQRFRQIFRFTVVRNPWDRLVSSYFFLRQGGFDEKDRAFFESELSGYKDFETFVRHWVRPENIRKWNHFKPQYDFLCPEGDRIRLDMLCFLENMQEDIELTFNLMGSSNPPEIRQTNRADHASYVTYYSPETRDIVSNVYRKDIELLGYSFDNGSLARQIEHRNAQVRSKVGVHP